MPYLKLCASLSTVNPVVLPLLWYEMLVTCSVVSLTSWHWWDESKTLDRLSPCPDSSTGLDKTSAICSERDWCFVAFNETEKLYWYWISLNWKIPKVQLVLLVKLPVTFSMPPSAKSTDFIGCSMFIFKSISSNILLSFSSLSFWLVSSVSAVTSRPVVFTSVDSRTNSKFTTPKMTYYISFNRLTYSLDGLMYITNVMKKS